MSMNINIETFKKHGYCIVRSAISNELRDFITQYALFDEMQDFSSEWKVGGQFPQAHSKYADPAMETLLLILQTTMETNTGLILDPTYSYYRVYREGDELAPHTDRPPCEISCTLCFNYDYKLTGYQWPIYMEGNPVILNPGDLVIYRGCSLKHWRDKFNSTNDESWQVQGFFHFVDRNGPYPDWKFDKREMIGEPLKSKQETSIKPYIHYTTGNIL